MSLLDEIVSKLDPIAIARTVGRDFDEAFNAYRLNSNVVGSFAEFMRLISDFYNFVFTRCVTKGGRLSAYQAESRAEDALGHEYRRRGGDIMTAFNNARDGTDGGMRAILAQILDTMQSEATNDYVRSILAQVPRDSWEAKVAVIRALLDRADPHLAMSLHGDTPERYAEHYAEFVREYCEGLRRVAVAMRKH